MARKGTLGAGGRLLSLWCDRSSCPGRDSVFLKRGCSERRGLPLPFRSPPPALGPPSLCARQPSPACKSPSQSARRLSAAWIKCSSGRAGGCFSGQGTLYVKEFLTFKPAPGWLLGVFILYHNVSKDSLPKKQDKHCLKNSKPQKEELCSSM